jgi:hypothetical protein
MREATFALAAVAVVIVAIMASLPAEAQVIRTRQRTTCVGLSPTFVVTTATTLTQRSALLIQNGNSENAIYCSLDPDLTPSVTSNAGLYIAPKDQWYGPAWRQTGWEPTCVTSVVQTSATGCTTAVQFR